MPSIATGPGGSVLGSLGNKRTVHSGASPARARCLRQVPLEGRAGLALVRLEGIWLDLVVDRLTP